MKRCYHERVKENAKRIGHRRRSYRCPDCDRVVFAGTVNERFSIHLDTREWVIVPEFRWIAQEDGTFKRIQE